jgi:hypothetical protein
MKIRVIALLTNQDLLLCRVVASGGLSSQSATGFALSALQK